MDGRHLSLRKRLGLELYRRLHREAVERHELRTLFWECTLRCNLRCGHCGSDCTASPDCQDMPAEDFFRVLDRQITPRVDPHRVMVVLSGGEVLVRSDLERIGRALYDREYPWGMVTNGMALTPQRFDGLLGAGLHSMTVSIDGFEAEHNRLRRHPLSFARAAEAVRMAAAELRADLDGAGGDLSALEGLEYSAEFFDPTDKLGADKPNPKSHVAYGFATHVVILDGEGRVKEVYAAHDSGKVVNPTSIQGQIEGGVLMGLGYALTEDFPLKDCVPQAKFGTLGLMRADQIPDIHAIYVEKEELLPFAYGAKGIGEIATIPTAPAVQGAYYARDHILRTSLPMQDTFYKKPAKKAAP